MKLTLERASYLLAILSAGLLWLAFPGGGDVWPLLFVALVPFFAAARLSSSWQRFWVGLIGGLAHFLLQLYWIVFVLGRYGGLPWYFAYPAAVLLALYMALYFGFFLVLAGGVLRRFGPYLFLWLAPFVWVGLDWLRGVLFSGFPWMDLGYGLWRVPLLVQSADLLGHSFLTFLIVLVNGAVFLLFFRQEKIKNALHWLAVFMLVTAVGLYGYGRSRQLESRLSAKESVTFGIVQGNIDQSRKWNEAEQRRTINNYIGQTAKLLAQSRPPSLVVWPETALPFYPTRNALFHEVLQLAGKGEIALLTGAPWFEIEDADRRIINFFNGALLITPDGEGDAKYFKSHLVPFGEYVPLRKILFFLAPLVEAVGDFTPGRVEQPLVYGKTRCGVLICFESIFPDISRKWVHAGANVLVNLTNDAWYGRSSAPEHSLAMSVLRAVESRRSLVRAANTGISGFVDPLGRVVASSAIFVSWAKSTEVKLCDEISIYCRFGYLFGPFCLAVALLASMLSGYNVRRRKFES